MDRTLMIEQLNHQLAMEYAALLQYHHYGFLLTGLERKTYYDLFLAEAQESSSHALVLGNWITALGGQPTTVPAEVRDARDLHQMLENSLMVERAAHDGYVRAISLAADDVTLRLEMENLAQQERQTVNELEKILQKVRVG